MENKTPFNIPKPKSLKEEFLDTFKIFKEHKELFFLTPAIIGGGIQLFYLLSIDFKFIRFFSVSQLLADGLVFLLFIIFIFASYRILYFLFNYLAYTFFQKKYGEILFDILVYLLFFLLIITKHIDIIPVESFIYSLFYVLVFLSIIIILRIRIKYESYFYKKFLKFSLSISIIVLSSFILFGLLHHIQKLNSPYFLNYINVMQVVDESFPDKKESKILYYNDKYIFVEIINGGDEKKNKDIYVLEQHVFFDDFLLKAAKDIYKKSDFFEKKDSIQRSKIDSLTLIIKRLKKTKNAYMN